MTRREPPLVPHLAGLGTTVFAEMSALAAATDSVNLGQGFPDTDGPASVARAAADAVLTGLGNQYPPGPGIPELRAAIAEHQAQVYGWSLDPEREVLVTAGATEAITAAVLALVDVGDEVVALEPFFDSYPAAVAMARGVLRGVRLRPPDFRLEESVLRAAVGPRTRVLLLNTPHNPTGAVLSRAELELVADVARRHDLLVVSDEVYEHLAFDRQHLPIARLPGMAERTVTISSAGKTFSFTGWKVGWAVGPTDLVQAVRTTKQYLTYVSAGPFQYAVAHALRHELGWVDALRGDLARRRDVLGEGLAAAGLTVFRPRGTYFVTTDVRSLGWSDGVDFCRALPGRAGVVAIPCSVFYADPDDDARALVRWTFSKQDDVLHQALDRLSAADLTAP